MLTFTNYRDLSDAYPVISANLRTIIHDDDIEEPFMWSLGGDVHIVETEEEYRKILSENSSFDMAEEIVEGWFLLLSITNNAGGHSYYVPIGMVPTNDRPTSYNA